MAQFQQRPEEQKLDWAGLPSEPLDPGSPAEALPETPTVDPFAVAFGTTTSMTVPVAEPADEPEA